MLGRDTEKNTPIKKSYKEELKMQACERLGVKLYKLWCPTHGKCMHIVTLRRAFLCLHCVKEIIAATNI